MWFNARAALCSATLRPRSYGNGGGLVQRFLRQAALAWAVAAIVSGAALAADQPVKIVALGDSLTAGYQLPASAAFPARLERALKAKGMAVDIANAGVSGDTSSGGLARLDWSVPEGTDAVILELGANDMLRGVDPKLTRKALETIVRSLKSRGVEVLLAGMRAPPNMGPEYRRAFDTIFPDLASAYGLVFYSFILDGIVADPKLKQRDGMHPNEAGVDVIVGRILPKVEELVGRVRARR